MTMDISILSLLVEDTIPCGVTFNTHGVALRGLRHVLIKGNFKVLFDTCAVGGLWGGAIEIRSHTWGFASPLMRQDLRVPRFEECADRLWEQAHSLIARDGVEMLPYFKKEYSAWKSLSAEQKYSLFKETDFYSYHAK